MLETFKGRISTSRAAGAGALDLPYYRSCRALHLGNTLVAYYGTADFPAVLRQCLRRCTETLGWPEDVKRDEALFARAMALNAEAADYAVRPLDRRLNELFGSGVTLGPSMLTALSDAFMQPIFRVRPAGR